ncbi:16604_t:CDS:2 [Funneliformis geosporum]|uniref:13918_t:CDS:1 n=1 Tax=Funneliformis geosporum TaxID=1117311 RepID=A0A9W4SHF6_9GLOM|nr:16604_t:CDS:2 [Funneliformis geosporum]CAI2169843.1 13918_t:CDS:2 [Funneliformis geosporum]
MNRNFIFAFILLVTISIVNASPLQLSGKNETQPGEQTFEVFITLKNYDIIEGTSFDINVVDQERPRMLVSYSLDLCSLSEYPIKAESKAGSTYFSMQKITLPKILSKYFIRVEHFLNAPDVTVLFSCAIAIIG